MIDVITEEEIVIESLDWLTSEEAIKRYLPEIKNENSLFVNDMLKLSKYINMLRNNTEPIDRNYTNEIKIIIKKYTSEIKKMKYDESLHEMYVNMLEIYANKTEQKG